MSSENRFEVPSNQGVEGEVGELAEQKELRLAEIKQKLSDVKSELHRLSNDKLARKSPDFDQKIKVLTQEFIKYQEKERNLLNSAEESFEYLNDNKKHEMMKKMFGNNTTDFKQ